MKIRILALISFFITFFYAGYSFAGADIDGWKNAKWGMTKKQIENNYQLDPEWYFDKVSGKSTSSIRLKNHITLLDDDANVFFVFNEKSSKGKLKEVGIFSHFNTNSVNNLINLYVKKYGQPNRNENFTKYDDHVKIITWVKKSGTLTLRSTTSFNNPFNKSMVKIIYSGTDKSIDNI